MKTFTASFLATLLVGSFSIPVGEPGETVVINDNMVTYKDSTPVEGAMQIIQGERGVEATATCTVYFVVE